MSTDYKKQIELGDFRTIEYKKTTGKNLDILTEWTILLLLA